MKLIFALVISLVIITSCKKEIRKGNTADSIQNVIAPDEPEDPPVHVYMIPKEAPLPERPYILMDYINVSRAYTNIPQSSSYSYSYERTVEKEAGETYNNTYVPPPTIIVDYDTYQPKPAYDILTKLDCFTKLSDIGATCSIELLTDIPVDGKPDMFFNWDNQSPGHTFLQIKKTNLGRTLVLNFGFYPVQAWKAIYYLGYIPGKIVNDSEHEYNASMKMNLTPVQLATVIASIRANVKVLNYDIDDYNCTDFAIKIINSVRPTNPLVIPKYQIPGGNIVRGTSTPQGLYKEIFTRYKYDRTATFTFSQYKMYAEPTRVICL